MSPIDPVASLRGVRRTYPVPTPVQALRGVDLDVHAGEVLTISGPSGSGKSTLLSLLGLLDRPTAGSVQVAGVDASSATDSALSLARAQHLGFVFQSFHLLARRTVLENVALAGMYAGVPLRQRLERARSRIEDVGLSHRSKHLTDSLSGGERQRVAIARALAASPDMLLCDEPTGNLDTVSGHLVLDLLLEQSARGIAVVIVTHDPEIAGRGDRHAMVRDGFLAI